MSDMIAISWMFTLRVATCAHPEFVYQAARNNALVGELVSDGNGVAKAIMASPFPIPNNGLEIIWNHTLRYRGYKLQQQFTAIQSTSPATIIKLLCMTMPFCAGLTRRKALKN